METLSYTTDVNKCSIIYTYGRNKYTYIKQMTRAISFRGRNRDSPVHTMTVRRGWMGRWRRWRRGYSYTNWYTPYTAHYRNKTSSRFSTTLNDATNAPHIASVSSAAALLSTQDPVLRASLSATNKIITIVTTYRHVTSLVHTGSDWKSGSVRGVVFESTLFFADYVFFFTSANKRQ